MIQRAVGSRGQDPSPRVPPAWHPPMENPAPRPPMQQSEQPEYPAASPPLIPNPPPVPFAERPKPSPDPPAPPLPKFRSYNINKQAPEQFILADLDAGYDIPCYQGINRKPDLPMMWANQKPPPKNILFHCNGRGRRNCSLSGS